MSFKKFIADPNNSMSAQSNPAKLYRDLQYKAWMACSAESEAEIAALKSERDALRNAIKAALICGMFDFQKFEALVSTPASGEPARKL